MSGLYRLTAIASISVLTLLRVGLADDLSGVPAKIQVTVMPNNSGSIEHLKIELLDPANQPASAKKDVQIEVEAKDDTGKTTKSSITIKQGEKEATIQVPTKSTGILEIAASNPELAQGGTVLSIAESGHSPQLRRDTTPMATIAPRATPVRPPTTAESLPSTLGDAVETGSNLSQNPGARESGTHTGHALARDRTVELSKSHKAITRAPASVEETSRSMAAAPQPPPTAMEPTTTSAQPATMTAPAPNGSLKLRYYPNRKFRAEDRDPVTIWAGVPGNEPAATDLLVYVMSDLGPLTPEPIKIPRGGLYGEAKLSATQPGSVNVWCDYSIPPETPPDKMLTIDFIPPVWAPSLIPTQKVLTLFDTVNVAVELIDFHRTTVPPDQERTVKISLDKGSGSLSATEVKLTPGAGGESIKFTPTLPGKIILLARSDFLPNQPAEITVTFPVLLLGLCVVGGAIGGLLAYWTQKPNTAHRIWIGALTGFLLYWAAVFGLVTASALTHAVVINPITAIALPLLGGWGGTKVITVILKGLGWATFEA